MVSMPFCMSAKRGEGLFSHFSLTIDEGIEDELAVFLHQIVDVSKDATVQDEAPLAIIDSNCRLPSSQDRPR